MILSPNIYKLVSVEDTCVITLDEVGKWLNLSPSAISYNSSILLGLINTAVETVEKYTWLDLRRKQYQAMYDLSCYSLNLFLCYSLGLALQRAPIIDLADIISIEYLENDAWTTFSRGAMSIDGLYENTTEREVQRGWAVVKIRESISIQNRCNAYKLRITFNTGFEKIGINALPASLRTALNEIVAFLYTNRGDCDSKCNLNGLPVPCTAKGLVDKFALSKTILGDTYNSIDDEYCYD